MPLIPGKHRTRGGYIVRVSTDPGHDDRFRAPHPTHGAQCNPLLYDKWGTNIHPGNSAYDIDVSHINQPAPRRFDPAEMAEDIAAKHEDA